MNVPNQTGQGAELRDYLAEERTFLAWIRTGLALMGFGFIVAHLGLFVDEPKVAQYYSSAQMQWLAASFGGTLVALGVIVNVLSARRYVRIIGELNRTQAATRRPSKEALAVAMFLVAMGIAMTLYLLPSLSALALHT
jgi:putative membrane protein